MLQVVASLLYADSGTHVEKRSDFEAFLLVSYEGIELSAEDKPCNLLNGCASFKFKLSQVVIINLGHRNGISHSC
jgi:all-trans-nonaprenyl-diphosphate synthase